MHMAQRFSDNGKGVVLFIEDIDRVLNERDDMTNEISLLMDGGESKNKNIITILTTNHVEDIDPTFLRGKRIGSIVTLTHPDAVTAKAMLENQLQDEFQVTMIEDDITEASQEIENLKIVPAFISEITDKVKTHQIFSGRTKVSNQDIMNSISAFARQMGLAKLKEGEKTKDEIFVEAYKGIVEDAVRQVI